MFSSFQVSLGDSSLEADHIISAIPASGNGIAPPPPFPSQGEVTQLLLGQRDHTMPLNCSSLWGGSYPKEGD